MDYYDPPKESHYEQYVECAYQAPMPNDIDMPSLKNFQKEAPDLYRSAFPKPWELRALAKAGISLVINFSLLPDLSIPGGPDHLIHIPSLGYYPPYEDVVEFLQLVNYVRKAASYGYPHKMLVHCIFGKDRTGLMIAAYQRVFEDRPMDEVLKEYAHFGHKDFAYFQEMIGTEEKVEVFRRLASYPPKEKYIRKLKCLYRD